MKTLHTSKADRVLTMKRLLVCASLLLSSYAFACPMNDLRACSQQTFELLKMRALAIQGAFGDTSFALPPTLHVKFVSLSDPARKSLRGMIHYDSEAKRLLIPRGIVISEAPMPLSSAAFYWPFYTDENLRAAYPVIEAIDNALWTVFLEEAALSNGQHWPHGNCDSADVTKRLPCRMLITAAAGFVKVRRNPIFNENRLDRIWPAQLSALARRNFSQNDSAYSDVQRFGGIMLLRPLIAEFGVPRVLAYVAGHPMEIEEDSVHSSSVRYQERAREALSAERRKGITYAQLPAQFKMDDAG